MIDPQHCRQALAREWARSVKPGARFTGFEADSDLVHAFLSQELPPQHMTGFGSLPSLQQLTKEGILEQTGDDEWKAREATELAESYPSAEVASLTSPGR